MFQNEIKMRISQNCTSYKPRNIWFGLNSGTSLRSCDNCIHFVRKKCEKDLYDQIKEMIRLN